MVTILNNNVFHTIDAFAKSLEAKTKKGYGFSVLQVNNHFAKGRISAFHMFSGFSCMTYSIEFKNAFELTLEGNAMNTLYFIYCMSGSLTYAFEDQGHSNTINTQQNAIMLGKDHLENKITLPGNTKLNISFIYITENELLQNKITKSNYLQASLSDIFTQLEHRENYQFFGRVRPKTAEYVKLLIDNRKIGLVGRLITESSIFQILISQLENHDEEIQNPQISSALSRNEINSVIRISEKISRKLEHNLSVEELCKMSGLSPRKLQMGFRYLYGMTVSRFIIKARMERSRELMETTELTISEIVYSVGLSSRSYFSKIFKEMYTFSPNEYKKLYASQ